MGRSALLALLLIAALSAIAPIARSAPQNPYGVMMFPNPGEDFDLVLARARGLGVSWFRPPTVALRHWMIGAPCPACAVYGRSGLKLAVTVRNTSDPFSQEPSPPPEDLTKFRASLTSLLVTMRPALVAIENEENSARFFAGGNDWAHAYATELKAGCDVAHEHHVSCTNGGLTGEAAAALTWLGYLEHDQADRACDFAKRAMPLESLCAYHSAGQVSAALKDRLLGPAAALLNLYRSLPIDEINFHWFGPDSRAFAETAEYLAQVTGRPAITNEFGQRRNAADPKDVRPLLRAVIAENIPLAVWYSVDTTETESLFGKDGRLRPTGWEFQRQLAGLR